MKTIIIKHGDRSMLEILSFAEYQKLDSESVVSNVSMFFDPYDEKHTTVISYHV